MEQLNFCNLNSCGLEKLPSCSDEDKLTVKNRLGCDYDESCKAVDQAHCLYIVSIPAVDQLFTSNQGSVIVVNSSYHVDKFSRLAINAAN